MGSVRIPAMAGAIEGKPNECASKFAQQRGSPMNRREFARMMAAAVAGMLVGSNGVSAASPKTPALDPKREKGCNSSCKGSCKAMRKGCKSSCKGSCKSQTR